MHTDEAIGVGEAKPCRDAGSLVDPLPAERPRAESLGHRLRQAISEALDVEGSLMPSIGKVRAGQRARDHSCKPVMPLAISSLSELRMCS
jgi:hypothetical protein